MSLHNLWLRSLLPSSHFRDPLPIPADMLNIERGQNLFRAAALYLHLTLIWARDSVTALHFTERRWKHLQSTHFQIKARVGSWHRKAAHFFPITFLSGVLQCVITSRTVIFTFPDCESFNSRTWTAQQSITRRLYLLNLSLTRLLLTHSSDLVLFLTLCRRELRNSPWQLIVVLISNVNSGYHFSNRY